MDFSYFCKANRMVKNVLESQLTKDKIEAGLDEVGRGCLAGPVVAAAVILPKDYRHELLDDSKKLTKKKRDILRDDIKKDAIAWYIAEVSHTKIDEIYILNASFLAMHNALDETFRGVASGKTLDPIKKNQNFWKINSEIPQKDFKKSKRLDNGSLQTNPHNLFPNKRS